MYVNDGRSIDRQCNGKYGKQKYTVATFMYVILFYTLVGVVWCGMVWYDVAPVGNR